jgi:hypothetical protein
MAVVVAILIGALALGVGQNAVHPQITRQQAIQAALRYGSQQSYPRVQAKYMRYSDLAKSDPRDFMLGAGSRDHFIWVVAVSGRYGLSPLGRTTWGLAVIEDDAGSLNSPFVAGAIIFMGGVQGDWPPFFDNLPALAQEQAASGPTASHRCNCRAAVSGRDRLG